MQPYNRQAISGLTVEHKRHQVKLSVAKIVHRQGARYRQLRFNSSGSMGITTGVIIVMADSFYLK